jgi:TonB family protein
VSARARLRGLTLSVLLHVGAAAAIVAWSAAEWTRPLFVDLLERAEPTAASGGDTPATAASRPVRRPPGRVATAGSAAPRSAASAVPAAPMAEPVAPAAPPPALIPMAPVAPPPVPPSPTAPPAAAIPPSEPGPSLAASPHAATSSPGQGRVGASEPGSGARAAGETRGDAASGPPGGPGSPLALATPGGSVGAPPEYGPYLRHFRQRVHEALIYPLAARRQGLGGTVELDVWLEATGRVRDVWVVRSSSHRLLDEAAVETIRGLGPIRFPDSLPRRSLLIRIPLVFELR